MHIIFGLIFSIIIGFFIILVFGQDPNDIARAREAERRDLADKLAKKLAKQAKG